jgi:hypothetical protein
METQFDNDRLRKIEQRLAALEEHNAVENAIAARILKMMGPPDAQDALLRFAVNAQLCQKGLDLES